MSLNYEIIGYWVRDGDRGGGYPLRFSLEIPKGSAHDVINT